MQYVHVVVCFTVQWPFALYINLNLKNGESRSPVQDFVFVFLIDA